MQFYECYYIHLTFFLHEFQGDVTQIEAHILGEIA